MSDKPWEEDDEEFEGVGAHPENARYDHDDGTDDEVEDPEPEEL
jgi:hypothetical protein